MNDSPKGHFEPVHTTLPDPNEPDWDNITDLDVGEIEILSDTLGEETDSPAEQFTAALMVIRTVLRQKIDEINREGVDLFKSFKYEEAKKLATEGERISGFQSKAESLYQDWLIVSKEIGSSLGTARLRRAKASRDRAAARKLIIRFEDGEQICENSAADSFSRALHKMGLAKIESLGILKVNHPLVSNAPPKKYQYKEVDGYFIVTHSSTETKRRLIEEISDKLEIPLQVEILG